MATIFKTQKKLMMGNRTRCAVCGAVNKNTVMMDRRTSKNKLICPLCGRVLKKSKVKKPSQKLLTEAFLRAAENLQKLADDRIIPRP